MTSFLRSSLRAKHIRDPERRVEHAKKEKRQQLKLQKIERAPVGQITQKCKRLGLTQQESVVFPCQQVGSERDDKIHLGPGEGAQNPFSSRPKTVNQHQESDPNDD